MTDALYTITKEAQAQEYAWYSRLKLGNPDSIARAAWELSGQITGCWTAIRRDPRSYVIAYPGTGVFEVPNSAQYIATELGRILGLPSQNVIGLVKTDLSGTPYFAAGARERYSVRDMTLTKRACAVVSQRRVIIVDDCVAGGASLAKSRLALAPHVSALTCHVLLDLSGSPDPARMEEIVNSVILAPDPIAILASIWNDESNYTASKLVAYTLRQDLQVLGGLLNAHGAAHLYVSALLFFHAEPAEIERAALRLGAIAEVLERVHGLSTPTPRRVVNAIAKNGDVQEGRRAVLLDWLRTGLAHHRGFRVPPVLAGTFLCEFGEMVDQLARVPFA